MSSRFPHAIALALALFMFSTPAFGQSDGKISGTVKDASGAGIPGATVAATNLANKDYKTATTGADGSYSLALPPGSYTVAITLPGFRRSTHNVDVTAGGSRTLDVTLEAALSEEITVTAT